MSESQTGSLLVEGDTIEAVKGATKITATLWRGHAGPVHVGDSGWTVEALQRQGWTLTVTEKAAPKLPTEVGFYLTRHNALWTLEKSGNWKDDHDVWASWDAAHNEAPFTRLEPVPVTAKKVADALFEGIRGTYGKKVDGDACYIGRNIEHVFKNVRAEFGIIE